MKTFTDSAGQTWEMAVTGATIRRAEGLLGIDLGKLLEGKPPLLTRLHTDLVFLVDVLYVALKPQLDAAGVTDEAFAERLTGDAFFAAHEAFMSELTAFFRSLRQNHVAAAIERQTAFLAETFAKAEEILTGPELRAILDRQLDNIRPTAAPGRPVASSPPSPAVTPNPEP